jgi:adenylyl- and sulfurtransferase ThiI
MNNDKHQDQLDLTGYDRDDLEEKLIEIEDNVAAMDDQIAAYECDCARDWLVKAKSARGHKLKDIKRIKNALEKLARDENKKQKALNVKLTKQNEAERQKRFIVIAKRVLPHDMYELVMGEFKRVNSLET